MNLLNGEPVCVLNGNEFLPIEGKTFADQVSEFFASQGGLANSPFGTVVLDRKGVQNSKQHGVGRIKAASFAAVKDVLENGEVILPLDEYGTNDKKELTGMVAAPIQIGTEKYVCVVEVIANLQLQRLYLHESFLTKNLQEIVASNSVRGSETSSPLSQGDGKITNILQKHLISKQNQENNQNNIKNESKYMEKKQVIRLTESDLHRIVNESVNKVLLKEWHDMRGEYVEGWIELAKDLYTRLNWVRYGIGEYLNTMDTQYHGQPYNQHMLKSLEYIEMAEKEMNQAKQDFMDMSNSKPQSAQL